MVTAVALLLLLSETDTHEHLCLLFHHSLL